MSYLRGSILGIKEWVMGNSTSQVYEALKQYADSLKAVLGRSEAPVVWPEDQLKSPVKVLLESVGKALGRQVIVTTEATQSSDADGSGGGRVDAAVEVGPKFGIPLLAGHVELKAPSKSGDPKQLKDKHDRLQWAKFQRLPNLIYTNGREWTLHRTGEQVGSKVVFSGDPVADGGSAVTIEDAKQLEVMLDRFFQWSPIVPKTSKQIADLLAPLCRLLRAEVLESLNREGSSLGKLANEMRKYLFPGASDEVVADAFAQAYTYALLIARLEGAAPHNVSAAKQVLAKGHGLLAEVLGLLDSPSAHREVATSSDTILRVIGEMDPSAIVTKHGDNPWLYFYEEFLAAYDPVLRKKVGAYYTPAEVVRAQVSMVRELLIEKFGRKAAFADKDVVTLDPAAGTGTYPLAILQSVVDAIPPHATGSLPAMLRRAMANLYGIEYLVGPYAVAHLRLSRFLADHGVAVSDNDPLNLLLADTLASHEPEDDSKLPEIFGWEELREEREAARELKADTRVVICIGNPPYLRGKKSDAGASAGGWVTMRRPPVAGRRVRDVGTGRMVNDPGEVGIIRDFIDPVVADGRGADVKNLYNAYVYFWRWALWKVFEQPTPIGADFSLPDRCGIVSFITASSFLRGPGFSGMRQHMRRQLDEIWVIDLGGDNKGGRRSENVFAIETPVAITIGVRYGEPNTDEPAKVHYTSLADLSANEKKARLARIRGLSDPTLVWRPTLKSWTDPFLPLDDEQYLGWPAITDLFPWQTSGAQLKRSWPIGESLEVLVDRWETLTAPLSFAERSGSPAKDTRTRAAKLAKLFHESRDRKVTGSYPDLFDSEQRDVEILNAPSGSRPEIRTYAFRSFDRQYVIADNRVGDFMRPSLWRTHSDQQRYLVSMLTEVIGEGPGAMACADVPDLHYFRGSFGGKHVIPLWRDSAATTPNVTNGLLDVLSRQFAAPVSGPELFAYAYGILSTPAFVKTYWDALTVPGAHLPITTDGELFRLVVGHGQRMLRLHTEELFESGHASNPAHGSAVYREPISADKYPTAFSYDRETHSIRVGDGLYTEVDAAVWDYSVSGFKVIDSWLGYRMAKRAGKRSSELDDIRPRIWPDPDGTALLQLLWTIERTIELQKNGSDLLDSVISGETFAASDFPAPADHEREVYLGDVPESDLLSELGEFG